MNILDDDDLRRPVRERDDAVDNGRAQGVELAGRGRIVLRVRRVAVLGDERQHEGAQPIAARKRPVEEGADLPAAFLRQFARHDLGRMMHVAYPGVERIVLVILQTLKDQGRPLGSDPLDELEHESRLADSGLAGDQHGLT